MYSAVMLKGMKKVAKKRQSTKSRIVKAAWNLFYKNGYDNTTVEEIINASKTSKGTFYHYFKGKEERNHQAIRASAPARTIPDAYR